MDKDLLRDVGEALYGSRWQSEIAKDLNVADRTVRRWMADAVISDGVAADLAQLARQRLSLIQQVIERLPSGSVTPDPEVPSARRSSRAA